MFSRFGCQLDRSIVVGISRFSVPDDPRRVQHGERLLLVVRNSG